MPDEIRVPIASDADLVPARAEARALALRLGFSRTDATLIATAISEIARNIVIHADGGELVMQSVSNGDREGMLVIAQDTGPGIRNVETVMDETYVSRGGPGLGLGLAGARRLMDDFDVVAETDRGTTVRMTKWRIRDELERLREKRRQGGGT